MKILRTILIILAIVCILFNVMAYFSGLRFPGSEKTLEERVAYIIGLNFLNIIGLILLMIAFFINKHIRKKDRKNLIENFLK